MPRLMEVYGRTPSGLQRPVEKCRGQGRLPNPSRDPHGGVERIRILPSGEVVVPRSVAHCSIAVAGCRYRRGGKCPNPGRSVASLAAIDRRVPPLRTHAFDIRPGARARCSCSLSREGGGVPILYVVIMAMAPIMSCGSAAEKPSAAVQGVRSLSLAGAAVMMGWPRSVRKSEGSRPGA